MSARQTDSCSIWKHIFTTKHNRSFVVEKPLASGEHYPYLVHICIAKERWILLSLLSFETHV